MKHYNFKDAIIHGTQLFHRFNSHENDLSPATELPLVAAGTAARTLRRMAAGEGEEDGHDFFSAFALGGDETGDDFFSVFLGGGNDESGVGVGDMFADFSLGLGGEDGGLGEFVEKFEECGIDVGEMAGKALGAFVSYASDLDMSSPESILGFDSYGPMLLALKDDDENQCEDSDLAKFSSASEEFLQCSGMNAFFDTKDIESGVFFRSIEDDCKPFLEMVTTRDIPSLQQDILDEESILSGSGKGCLQTFLGDNAVGNFIRYGYNHIDKILGCFSKLSEDLPHCILSLPVEGGDPVSFPISLEEKLTCVLGSSYEIIIEESCVDAYESLDRCLPQSGNSDVRDATFSCQEEGLLIGKQDGLLGMDASVLTGNKMPDFCSKIFKEKGMSTEELQSRLDYYNKKREYGWTIESIMNDFKDEVEAITAVPENEEGGEEDQDLPASSQVPEMPETLYKSTWTDGEPAPEDDIPFLKKCFPFLVAGLIISAVVLLALVAKYRFGASAQKPQPNLTTRRDYANLSMKLGEMA